MAKIIPKVGLLSTGDELINGSVLNTNSQEIAQHLSDCNIQPGLHLTTSDDQSHIENAMRYLLQEHQALIITGGLGPTSDDRTRFALSSVLSQPLIFNEDAWQRIIQRFQRLGLEISDNNRLQCWFPSNAEIYLNENGTASGCHVQSGSQSIFMLPGPPFECMPIFTRYVLPYLLANHFARPLFRYQWLLLGAIEGSVAAQLDPLIEKNPGCYIGYRINRPYLEVKLQSADQQQLKAMCSQIDHIIAPLSVSNNRQPASIQLEQYLISTQQSLDISDQATGGLLQATLSTPQTFPYLHFSHSSAKTGALSVTLSGLETYWRNQTGNCILNLQISSGYSKVLSIPFRKEKTLLYAVEMACWEILQYVRNSRKEHQGA